ncbi:hypothetical protein AAMO2058_000404200 [Amorphochlora amoebiformis]
MTLMIIRCARLRVALLAAGGIAAGVVMVGHSAYAEGVGGARHSMAVRTVTTGVNLGKYDRKQWDMELKKAVEVNLSAKKALEDDGFVVQSTRVTTNPFEEYAGSDDKKEIVGAMKELVSLAKKHDIQFLGVGPAQGSAAVEVVPDLVSLASCLSLSIPVPLTPEGIPDHNRALNAADACLRISEETPGGIGNFQLAVGFNSRPNIPFFPVGYHRGPSMAFSVGCETAPTVSKAMENSSDLNAVSRSIRDSLEKSFFIVDATAKRMESKLGVTYNGIDASVAPNPDLYSLTNGYQALGLGRFGQSGSLFISSLITQAAKSVRVHKTGYSGLMLPPLEDNGLAHLAMNTYRIHDLLLYSAVCGVGLDTVPIPGDTPREKIAALYMDCAALAFRLDKPLTARLFPVKGKKAGEMTVFDSPYMCNGKIFEVP